jgi:hypothetical protein
VGVQERDKKLKLDQEGILCPEDKDNNDNDN